MTARSELRAELSARLVPALRSLGFAGPASVAGNTLLHEYRRRSSEGTHVLLVQMEKRGRPRFVVNFHVEPPEGIETVHERGGRVLQGRLLPSPGAGHRHWFRTDPPWWKRALGLPGPSAAEVVQRCADMLPEIEAWWRTRAASPHISVLEHTFPGRPGKP